MEFQYEYQGRDGLPVSIKPNERYVLLAKTNDHWWQVQRDGNSKPFYIPAKYVKELPADFPSPLDFADPPGPRPVAVPVVAPVPVPVPVPKTLEEPKAKPSDEVTIRLRPDVSTGYRKTENRMSTFGVPLEFQDMSPLVAPIPRHPSEPPPVPVETAPSTGTTITAEDPLSRHSGLLDDQKDSGKPRVPSFSPADPVSSSRPHTQPIPVETPVVPVVTPHIDPPSGSSPPAGDHSNQDSPIEPEEEEVAEEEISVEESISEEDSVKGEDSHHIYESIQDLNLDVEALVRGRLSPGEPPEHPPEPAPALPPKQVRTNPGY